MPYDELGAEYDGLGAENDGPEDGAPYDELGAKFFEKKEKERNDQKNKLIFLQRFSLVCEFSFHFENQFIFVAEMELICQRKNFL